MTRTDFHGVAVAGKGGTGKSTLAALLVAGLLRRGQTPILAVDADPDASLGTLLGVQPIQSIGDLREEALKEIKNFPAGMSKASYVEAGLHQIVTEAEGFDLLAMGRAEGAGCYCYLNNLIRKFSDDLSPSYRWAVFDNEAGLEHLSRQTTRNVDALLIMVSESPLSLQSAARIMAITASLNSRIGSRWAVTNQVRPERRPEIERRLAEIGLAVIADIPHEPALEQLVLSGRPVQGFTGTAVLETIDSIIERIGGAHADS